MDQYIKAQIPDANIWVRPADWLPIGNLDGSTQEFRGLVFITPNSRVRVQFFLEGSGYAVDWGDGIPVNYLSSFGATKYYNFDDVDSPLNADGNKQAVIRVYPLSSNNVFTFGFSGLFLDVVLCFPHLTSLSYQVATLVNLQRFRFAGEMPEISVPNLSYMTSMRVLEMDWSKPTNLMSFLNTSGLTELGNLNMENASSFGMSYNFSVKKIGNIDFYGDSFNMIQNSVEEIGNINIHNATSLYQSFLGNSNLTKVGTINLAACTNAAFLFYNCNRIRKVSVVCPVVQNLEDFCKYCYNLREIVLDDASSITSLSGAFYQSPKISKLRLPGVKVSFGIQNADMGRDALATLIGDLGKPSETQTINIANNWGASQLSLEERQTATNKNWTIIG